MTLEGIGRFNMKSLGLRHKNSLSRVLIAASCMTSMALVDSLVFPSTAIAQAPPTVLNACPQLTNRRYAVILDRPANTLPKLPEFLAIAAVPCGYLNGSMTFFGGFDNAKASTFRANQLRQLGLDAVVHSFSAKVNDVPANLQAAMILVELNQDPSLAIPQVQALSGKGAVLATFNNRSVILAAPLSSIQNANAIAARLRSQGLAAQVISASLLNFPNPAPTPVPTPTPPTPKPSIGTIYRVLVPNINDKTLKEIRELAPDAFLTIFKGKYYIQVRTYNNRSNAHRERERLNARYPGTLLLQD